MANFSIAAKLREIEAIKRSDLQEAHKQHFITKINKEIEEFVGQGSLFGNERQEEVTPPAGKAAK